VSTATAIATVAAAFGAVLGGLGTLLAAMWGVKPVRHSLAISSGNLAAWTLTLGMSAWLLAAVLVTLVGTTTVSLKGTPILALDWGATACAIVAAGCGALSIWKHPRNFLQASAGIVASIGALAAVLVAGSTM
jgi:hypothetical protein